MVFYFRCFSFILEENEYETKTQSKSSTTYNTVVSKFSLSSEIRIHADVASHIVDAPSNLRVFTVTELQEATRNFCNASKIGEGGYGSVYKGAIWNLQHPFDEIQVAVKRAKRLSRRQEEWDTEIEVLGVVNHPNIVRLLGYCAEENEYGTQLYLVYEYMVHRSVRDHLHKESERPLTWNKRFKIARHAARGLAYLHEEMDFQVILRDFKSSNILLDDQWNVKLADFGLALLQPQELNTSTSFVGTRAYAAPECITLRGCTSKSDVWSYGVFLYELITGRRPINGSRWENEQRILEWVTLNVGSTSIRKIIDPRLEGKYPLKSAQKLLVIANKCLHEDPEYRPKMSEIIKMINQRTTEVASQPTGLDIKTSNDDIKDSVGNKRRLPSCLSCFIKKRNT